ncbi:hypothetical protein [Rhodospirillum sp. A1_3_36]|uniref:hypothetical protein n=1 Tax=Rhodospirillum sp. A1_3_36 TaxID=3391666 RepID=UPI0039A5DC14
MRSSLKCDGDLIYVNGVARVAGHSLATLAPGQVCFAWCSGWRCAELILEAGEIDRKGGRADLAGSVGDERIA